MKHLLIATLALALPLAAAPAGGSFLLKNVTVHPVSGPTLDGASVLVIDGRISEVGAKITPPKGKIKLIDGHGQHVWPGMINSATTVGLAEIGAIRETVDTGELGEFDPQLRPIVAMNPESEHIPVVRANGITMVALLPAIPGGGRRGGGSDQLIGGQISLANLAGWTWEEMAVLQGAGLHLHWPAINVTASDELPTIARATNNYATAKRAHDEQLLQLGAFFDDARAYWTAKKAGAAPKADLKFEAMIPVLEGKLPVIAFAEREREIKEALEFASKQQVKLVLAGVRKPGEQLDAIAKKGVPVILGHTQTSVDQDDDPYDEPYTLPSKLHAAGVKFCFATFDSEFARNLPYQAAQAVPYGLPYDTALRAVTLTAAEIWGVDKDYGSIEKGKIADLVLTDGDLLDPRTNVKQMFIRGNEVNLESKHTRLYKKYLARP